MAGFLAGKIYCQASSFGSFEDFLPIWSLPSRFVLISVVLMRPGESSSGRYPLYLLVPESLEGQNLYLLRNCKHSLNLNPLPYNSEAIRWNSPWSLEMTLCASLRLNTTGKRFPNSEPLYCFNVIYFHISTFILTLSRTMENPGNEWKGNCKRLQFFVIYFAHSQIEKFLLGVRWRSRGMTGDWKVWYSYMQNC